MEWKLIEDERPPIGELVWVYGGDAGIALAERYQWPQGWVWAKMNNPYFSRHNDRISAEAYIEDIRPTHWHPLPKLPKL